MATRAGEILGHVGGVALAPLTATISALRRSRMFHPRGTTLRAEVRACGSDEPWRTLGRRLEGDALVRLSGAWWKEREWPDVLGCAIRFTRHGAADARARSGDQDLLFATIRRPWTMPFAPLSTRRHDYLENEYFAVAPFVTEVAGHRKVIEWRLVPEPHASDGRERGARGGPDDEHAADDRDARLGRAVARGDARLVLEARPYRRVVDLFRHRTWQRVAVVALIEPVAIDEERLRFDAYRSGRGIRPTGFVQALRIAAYRASQWARPRSAT